MSASDLIKSMTFYNSKVSTVGKSSGALSTVAYGQGTIRNALKGKYLPNVKPVVASSTEIPLIKGKSITTISKGEDRSATQIRGNTKTTFTLPGARSREIKFQAGGVEQTNGIFSLDNPSGVPIPNSQFATYAKPNEQQSFMYDKDGYPAYSPFSYSADGPSTSKGITKFSNVSLYHDNQRQAEWMVETNIPQVNTFTATTHRPVSQSQSVSTVPTLQEAYPVTLNSPTPGPSQAVDDEVKQETTSSPSIGGALATGGILAATSAFSHIAQNDSSSGTVQGRLNAMNAENTSSNMATAAIAGQNIGSVIDDFVPEDFGLGSAAGAMIGGLVGALSTNQQTVNGSNGDQNLPM